METNKAKISKTFTIIISIVVLLAVVLAILYFYAVNNPKCEVKRSVAENNPEAHGEIIVLIDFGLPFGLNYTEAAEEKMRSVSNWQNSCIEEQQILFQNGPYEITVSGEMDNGKTTLRYKGYVTDANGERIEYLNEKTFDFVFSDKNHFFADN